MQAFEQIHKCDIVYGDFCANSFAFGVEPFPQLPYKIQEDSTYATDFYLFDFSASCSATHPRCSRREDIQMLSKTVLFLLRYRIKADDENPQQGAFYPADLNHFIVSGKYFI